MTKLEFEWILGAILLNTVEMVVMLLKIYKNVEPILYISLSLIPILIFNIVTYIYFDRKKKATSISMDNGAKNGSSIT